LLRAACSATFEWVTLRLIVLKAQASKVQEGHLAYKMTILPSTSAGGAWLGRRGAGFADHKLLDLPAAVDKYRNRLTSRDENEELREGCSVARDM
jgi:hypothetical protein